MATSSSTAISTVEVSRQSLVEKENSVRGHLASLEERRRRAATVDDELKIWSKCLPSLVKLKHLSLTEALDRKIKNLLADLDLVISSREEELAEYRRDLQEITSKARQVSSVECVALEPGSLRVCAVSLCMLFSGYSQPWDPN